MSHTIPPIQFEDLIDQTYADIGDQGTKPPKVTEDKYYLSLGFHIDCIDITSPQSVGLRFWKATNGAALAQFATVTDIHQVDAVNYLTGGTVAERMKAAEALDTSSPVELLEESIVVFASNYQQNTDTGDVLAASTPHLFKSVDPKIHREIASAHMYFPDPLAAMGEKTIDQLLSEYGLRA